MAALRTARFPWRLLELGCGLVRQVAGEFFRVPWARSGASPAARDGAIPPVRESAGATDLTPSAQVQELHNRCRQRLRSGTQRLLVDLTSVTGADTKLVASLVVLKRHANASGRTVEIVCSDQVRDWLRVYRLESLVGQPHPTPPGPPPVLKLDPATPKRPEPLAAAG